MRFSDVRHQDRALSILRRALRSGRTHHAYLFEGPPGVGKELTGRAIAARLLCLDDTLPADADACGVCGACRTMASDNHPDFHLIHRGLHKLHPDRTIRQSKGLFLAVDVIRHFLIDPAAMKPALGRRRVFLVRDAERMNEGAQNALLKTLEEPPGDACLILVTSSASRLLPTIRSRCQLVPFNALPPAFVAQELCRRLKLDAPAARALARLADGSLGTAAHWHQIGLLDALPAVLDALRALPSGDPEAFGKQVVEMATELAGRTSEAPPDNEAAADENGDAEPRTTRSGKTVATDDLRTGLKLILMLIAWVYRDALTVAAGAPDLGLLPRTDPTVTRGAHARSPDALDLCLRAVNEAERMLDRNVAPQLVCERLAVALTGEMPIGA